MSEHINILSQGIPAWNSWREQNPDVQPVLRDADLHETNLSGANLSRVDFSNTNLSRANLSGDDYTRSDLSYAILRRANLRNASLSRASLIGARLRKAELCGADLSRSNLNEAYLIEADLTGAKLIEADLSGANLQNANLNNSDLTSASLVGAYLSQASLLGANLSGADLGKANLYEADLGRATLAGAKLLWTNLTRVNLRGVNLLEADLRGASLIEADLSDADLTGATLKYARLIDSSLEGARLTGCFIYGISAWNLNLKSAEQSSLVITRGDEPTITIDNLRIAQFIHLLLDNAELRDVIDTITSKVVLILGRFTPERKALLEAIRVRLRKHDYLPVIFDFERPAARSLTETMSTLAHMARFVIADITDPGSIPQELQRIIPDLPSVPVQPLIQSSSTEFGMFRDFLAYPWVLMPVRYDSCDELLDSIDEKVIAPAMRKAQEAAQRRKDVEEGMRR